MLLILSLLSGTTVAIGTLLLVELISGRAARMKKGVVRSSAKAEREEGFAQNLLERLLLIVRKFATQRLRPLFPAERLRRLDNKLGRAGHPWGLVALEYLVLKLFISASLALLSVILALSTHLGQKIALLGLLNALILPNILDFFIAKMGKRREMEISSQLPSVLDLLVVSMEAGLSFDAALGRIRRRIKGPVGEELSRLAEEVNMGRSRPEALAAMAERTGVKELKGISLALSQGEQTGTSLSRVLRSQAEALRTRRQQKVREEAMKIPIKMVFPMLFFIFPAMFLVLLGPAALRMVGFFMGQ